MIDDLFKWANKYSMLDDDVRAITEQILVTSRLAKNDHARSLKPSSQLRQASEGWDDQQ